MAGSASEHTAPAIHNSIAPKHDQVIDHEPQPPSSALQDLIDWHSGGDHDEVPDVAATEKHDSTANRLVEMQSDTLAWIDSADLSGATSPPAALRPASSHEELTALSPRHQAAASETVLDAHAWMVGDEVDEADQHADPDADGKDADANPARSDDAARSMTAALRTSSLPNLRSTQMQMRSAWCDARVSVCRTRESHARLALLQARAASLQEELRMLAKRVG
ncbi:hypothetical protein HK105_207568 [Polyrhizophydium stewartii]|uniref:Uncharacterized protein n=1 Tax=Polyrhizophydium stewartii TaxID=2732419 RepID=A0ABR4N038_9FUNG